MTDLDYAESWMIDRTKPIPLPITKKQILGLPKQFNLEDLDTSFIYFSYLMGSRVTETLNTTPNDLEVKTLEDGTEALIVRVLTLKNRKMKRLGIPYRYIPTPLAQPIEKQMADVIIKHADFYQQRGINKLYPFHRATAWRHSTKITIETQAVQLTPTPKNITIPDFHCNPHYWRHCRLTDLVVDYNYDSFKLKKFAGWSSLQPAEIYVTLNWKELLAGMR